jgi:dTDP-6-deoxy-L-talose 4-dehydrogenase (NAD+)
MMLLTQNTDVNLYWLRAYYITGDDMRNSSIFTKLLQAEEEGKKEFPFTTGVNQYDFIDVKELAEMIVAASTQDAVTGIINVCTGTPVSLRDKVEAFIDEKKLEIKLNYGAFPERPYDSRIIYGNNEKIKSIMGAD